MGPPSMSEPDINTILGIPSRPTCCHTQWTVLSWKEMVEAVGAVPGECWHSVSLRTTLTYQLLGQFQLSTPASQLLILQVLVLYTTVMQSSSYQKSAVQSHCVSNSFVFFYLYLCHFSQPVPNQYQYIRSHTICISIRCTNHVKLFQSVQPTFFFYQHKGRVTIVTTPFRMAKSQSQETYK